MYIKHFIHTPFIIIPCYFSNKYNENCYIYGAASIRPIYLCGPGGTMASEVALHPDRRDSIDLALPGDSTTVTMRIIVLVLCEE